MKVILVNGSPHPKGCTHTALMAMDPLFREAGLEVSHFWLGAKPIGGCIDCRQCVKTGLCVFHDKVNEFLETAGAYDAYVFGTPVHWGASSGNMKSFMDRAFFADFCGEKGRFRFKPAAGVASARRSGTVATTDQLNRYFSLSQMPVVTARYWNGVHGMTPAEVEEDREGVQNLRFLARNMAWLVRALAVAREAGVAPPVQEPVEFTNFIRSSGSSASIRG